MNHTEGLGSEPIGKLLLKYSLPAILGMMVVALYNIVDRIFIGHIPDIGPLAITGVGITMPITTIILAFEMMIGIGASANIAKRLGEGKKGEAERFLGNAFTLATITGIIIMVIGTLFADQILRAFGASDQTLFYAKEYIHIVLMGVVFYLCRFSINTTIRTEGNPRMAAATLITSCGLNIILDPIFIFGFGWGIKGAAFATILSQLVVAIWVIWYYTKGKSTLRLYRRNLRLHKRFIQPIFAIGVASFFMQIAASVVQVLANNGLQKYGGDLAIGAMASIASISMIFLMPVFGINQGSLPIIGFNHGAKNKERTKKTFYLATIAATAILTIGFLVTQFLPEMLLQIFTNDKQLMEIAVNGIRIYLLMLPVAAISITGANYFQSIGKAKISIFLSLLRQILLLIPLLIILPRHFGLIGVWLAQPIADFFAATITGILLIREFKR